MTPRTRYARSLAEAFPDERAAAVYGPYRRHGPLSRVLSWLEALVRRMVRRYATTQGEHG